jgi:uncharacterized protein
VAGTFAGLAVFEGIAPLGLVGLAAIYFLSYFIKGVVGFGALTPAILFGSFLVPPHYAVLLALMANATSQLQFIPEGVRFGDWGVVARYVPAYLTGVAIGVVVFANLDARRLTLVLGLSVAALMIAELLRLPERVERIVNLRSTLVGNGLATASGALTGVTGAGGLFFMVALLKLSGLAPRPFRATTFLLSAFSILWRTALLTLGGFITVTLLVESLLLLPPVVLGGLVGSRLFHRLSAKFFFAAVQILLLAGALGLVWQGLS